MANPLQIVMYLLKEKGFKRFSDFTDLKHVLNKLLTKKDILRYRKIYPTHNKNKQVFEICY